MRSLYLEYFSTSELVLHTVAKYVPYRWSIQYLCVLQGANKLHYILLKTILRAIYLLYKLEFQLFKLQTLLQKGKNFHKRRKRCINNQLFPSKPLKELFIKLPIHHDEEKLLDFTQQIRIFSSFIKQLKYFVANKSGFEGEGASRQQDVTLVSLCLSQLLCLAVRAIKSIQGEGKSYSSNIVAKSLTTRMLEMVKQNNLFSLILGYLGFLSAVIWAQETIILCLKYFSQGR